MSTFTLRLRDTSGEQSIENVLSFNGEDASGRFSILAGHIRMMTSLVFGLACFTTDAGDKKYLAMPGGLLYFVENTLFVSTRRYIMDTNYESINEALQQQLLKEEQKLINMKSTIRSMEEQMLKRIWQVGREAARFR